MQTREENPPAQNSSSVFVVKMARKVTALLLIFVAIVGLTPSLNTSAAPSDGPSPIETNSDSPALSPTLAQIGYRATAGDVALPASVGSESKTEAPPGSGSATALRVSGLLAGVAISACFF